MMKEHLVDYKIMPVGEKHLTRIAEIHSNSLPNDFCSLLGKDFLENIYYSELMNSEKVIGLCAVNEEGDNVLGYVFFLANERFLRDLLLKHFVTIFTCSLPRMLKITFILYVLSVFLIIFFRRRKFPEDGYELNYIAVDSEHQGRGIGSRLLSEGLRELCDTSSRYCWVKTLKSTQETITFYKKFGFEIYDEFIGRVYLYKKV